ncbi:heparinase II/III family protein [Ensifer soli]|uniref:heparinase II/III family protein n=1 Tax=Ciceribacter sp. sgz301302 TaxID=3342379 RepID=UPI0035BB5FE6
MAWSDRKRLYALYLRESGRRVGRALRAGGSRPLWWRRTTPDRLIVAPTDLRAIDPFVAEEILLGRFPLAGRVLETEGESPFEIDLPSRDFAVRLLSFSWVRHLRSVRDDAGPERLRMLVQEWIIAHGRPSGSISWEPDVAAQRVIAWLSHSPIILRNAEHPFYRRFLRSLGLQVRYLKRKAATTEDGEARLRLRIALAMASVAMPASAAALKKASRLLDEELDRQIWPDGGHCSRNPRVGLELLLDLLPLRQTYVNLGHSIPSRLIPCIDRMYPALRFFRHQGGELAHFNGATSALANELMSVLRYDETAGAPFKSLPHSQYERLQLEGVTLIVDTGKPASTALSRTAHAGCLSFEMSSGRHRFIVNAGSPKFASDRFRQLARATAAHSTVTVNDTSSLRFSASRFLGPVAVSGVSEVKAKREDTAGERESLVASHDGYLANFGLVHHRDLAIVSRGRTVRGRDRLSAADGTEPPATSTAVAAARFHIHPAITLRADGPHNVFLSAPDGETWLFSCHDAGIAIEEDVFFADPSGMRQSSQLVIGFPVASQPEIQWILTRQG